LQGVAGHCKAEVVGDSRLGRHDADDAPLHVDERSTTVAALDGNGDLEHRPALDLAPSRDNAGDDAVLETVRIADRDDGLAILDPGRVGQGQGGQAPGINADDREVKVAVKGVNGNGLVAFAIGQFDSDGAALADDVQVGGDEPLA